MLISFELANWMSFRDTAEFSMIASQEQQHGERLHRLEKHRMRIPAHGGHLRWQRIREVQLLPCDPFRQGFHRQGAPSPTA